MPILQTPRNLSGWRPSPPDKRDDHFRFAPEVKARPPVENLDQPSVGAPFDPAWDQGSLGSCFPSDTLIRMVDGNEKPITDVKLGQEVVTAEGRTGMVTKLMLRCAPDDGLISLCLWGRSAVRMTSEHPVLTMRGYIAAKDLTCDDLVALPRYRPAFVNEFVQTAELLSKKELLPKTAHRKFGTIPGRSDKATGVAVASAIPETIQLTARFGRLVGLFLAEGSTDSGKVRWTFGAHEVDTLVAETVDLLKDIGVEGYVQARPNNSINVVAYGTAWSRLWERLCGNGAGKKQLSGLLMSGSDGFLKSVLNGWLAGDGHYARSKSGANRTRGKSISKNLAMTMYDIAQHLGLRPVFKTETGKPSGRVKSRQDVYMVELNDHLCQEDYRSRQTESHVFRKVRRIERQPYDGYVYNMEVYGDNSYVADGIGVHNCGPNTTGENIVYDQLTAVAQALVAAGAVKMPSRLFIYYVTRMVQGTVDQDSGVDNRSMLKALQQYGWCDEELWPYDVNKFTVKPPPACFSQAAARANGIVYQAVNQDLDSMRAVVADLKKPIIFGFTVYQSMLSDAVAQTGDVPMPGGIFDRVAGGHDVLIYGYDDVAQMFNFKNHWSSQWGSAGNGRIPYAYATDPSLAGDFYVVTSVTPVGPLPTPPPGPAPIDIRAVIDAIFTKLIAGTANPKVKLFLLIAQKIIDGFLPSVQPVGAAVSPVVKGLIDKAFDAAIAAVAGKPLLQEVLKFAKMMVDAYLDSHAGALPKV